MSKANSIEEGTDAFSILKNKSFLSTRELSQEIDVINKSRWEKFLEVVWDGPKTDEERKYIRKLDIFLLTWGWYVAIGYPQKKNYIYAQVLTLCSYGYFVKLLDSNNFTNAYISGMREDVGITGDNYNYVQSIYMAGYVVGVVPSQIITLKVRPSIYFPCTELIWAVLTLCTSRVTTVEQLYAIRFLIGFFESPFYMGAISLLSDWYGEESLSKRACILYSASNVSSMFAGYLQAGIYNNLDGKGGRAGWQWLFIVCGCITIPLSLYGFIAIPDNPLRPSKLAFWLNDEDKKYAAKKYKQTRVAFSGFEFSEIKRMIFDWPFYVIIFCYTSYMIFTNAMSYFILFIQSLGRYSVAQENSIPTSAQAVALVFTLLLGWLADWKGRHLTLQIALTVNLVSCIFLLISPVEGCVWFGYIISGISWCYGPILLSWSQEFLRRSEMEAKFTVGVAQASAIANLIWATIVFWSTEKQYPYYRAAYIVCLILTVVQMPLTYGMNVLIKRKNMLDNVTKVYEEREKDVNS